MGRSNIKVDEKKKSFMDHLNELEMGEFVDVHSFGPTIGVRRVPGGWLMTTGAGNGGYNTNFVPEPIEEQTIYMEELDKLDRPTLQEIQDVPVIDTEKRARNKKREDVLMVLFSEIEILKGYTSYPESRIKRLQRAEKFIKEEWE